MRPHSPFRKTHGLHGGRFVPVFVERGAIDASTSSVPGKTLSNVRSTFRAYFLVPGVSSELRPRRSGPFGSSGKGFQRTVRPLFASQNRGFVGPARLDGSRGPPAFANMEMEALEKSKRIWIPHF